MNSHNAIPYPKETDPGAIVGWYLSPEFIAARFIAEDSLYSSRTPTPNEIQQKISYLLVDVQMAAGIAGMSDRQANSIAVAAMSRYVLWLTVVASAGDNALPPEVLASYTYGPVKQ